MILGLLAVVTLAANIFVAVKQKGGDTTPPEIRFDSEILEVSVQDKDYLSGVTAWDDTDGDLTDQVLVEHVSQLTGENTVKITYAVFDHAGNPTAATRTVRYTDYTGPEFHLSQPLNYRLGSTVVLLDRLEAVDELDGDITGRIRVTSQSISRDVSGVYYLGVQVTNNLGDTQVLELPVQILDGESEKEIRLSEYIVYLKQGEHFEPEEYLLGVYDSDGEKEAVQVEIQSHVDVNTAGVYEVTYCGEDAAQVILTVVVRG